MNPPSVGGTLRRYRAILLGVCMAVLVSSLVTITSRGSAVRAQSAFTSTSVPAGFTKSLLASGLSNPTVLAFAPNGDIYIGQQGGAILIYRNGAVLPTPVVTVPTDGTGEKGLLGLALDPQFATNGYMYVSYTTLDEHAQLSRLTVVNGAASMSSEVVYYKGNQAQNPHHSANDLHIGPDGKLWWSVGDNVPSISNGQTLTNIYGKILRFNLDGTIPSDNPFLHVPGAVPAIYAYGLRNPFRFTFLPNGKAMTEDTGSSYWEELDTIQSGGNYGWPFVEGNCFSCGYINPAYAYGHVPTDGAASAIAAYTGTSFPSQYAHVVFFGDYNRGDIEAVAFDPTYRTEASDTVFDSAAGTIADLLVGPDGALYYVSIFEGTFTKIAATGPFPEVASSTASPNVGAAPLNVQFSSAGSSDPYGQPLTYSWDFGDGSAVSTSANPSHIYTTNGTYTATLTVSNGTQSATSTATVIVGPTPPAVTLTSPTVGATYNAGNTISFSASATDAVDGTEPASAYSWQVDFISNGVVQPFYSAEVAHPFYTATGVTSGSFQIPQDLSNTPGSYYHLTLTVQDTSGYQTVVTRDIHPNLTTWSVNTNVPGAEYVVDGTWHTGPYSTQDVVGVQHVLSGVPAQMIGASKYRFNGWADGSALADNFFSSASGGAFTANYDLVSSTMPSPWVSTDVGTPLMAGTADYSSTDQTFYADGAGSDVYGANEQFHYVYQPLNGDGTIVARVLYQSESSPWTKAGVMVAASTANGTAFVDALVTPSVSPNTPNINGANCTTNGCDSPLQPITPVVGHGLHMQYTSTGDKSVTSTTALASYQSPNQWLKLQRVGNTFTSWYSTDGVNWTTIGSTSVTMATSVTIGLFVTAHNIGQFSSVGFDHVQVTSSTPPPPPPPPPGPTQLSNLVVNDTANAAKWSLQTNLQVGAVQYGDRSYTLATVPSSLLGASWIRTANASKSYTGNPLVTFTISQQTTVYVAEDSRLPQPSWMDSSWSNSGLTLTDSQATGSNMFILYAKVFPAGTVSLGPNSGTGTSSSNMYTVIVP